MSHNWNPSHSVCRFENNMMSVAPKARQCSSLSHRQSETITETTDCHFLFLNQHNLLLTFEASTQPQTRLPEYFLNLLESTRVGLHWGWYWKNQWSGLIPGLTPNNWDQNGAVFKTQSPEQLVSRFYNKNDHPCPSVVKLGRVFGGSTGRASHYLKSTASNPKARKAGILTQISRWKVS